MSDKNFMRIYRENLEKLKAGEGVCVDKDGLAIRIVDDSIVGLKRGTPVYFISPNDAISKIKHYSKILADNENQEAARRQEIMELKVLINEELANLDMPEVKI
jgi:hypothetical protein